MGDFWRPIVMSLCGGVLGVLIGAAIVLLRRDRT